MIFRRITKEDIMSKSKRILAAAAVSVIAAGYPVMGGHWSGNTAAASGLSELWGSAAAPSVQASALSGELIGSVEVLDTDYLASWSIDNSLGVGDTVFGDRGVERCAVSELPEFFSGAELLLTPCDAKNSSKDQAKLAAAKDMTLYVGLDKRVTTVPGWLSGFTKNTETIGTSNDVTFIIYSKKLSQGEEFTLGANGQSASCMNYIVFASDKKRTVRGDVSGDEVFDSADLVLMQKWLLAVPGTELAEWKAGDLCEDDILDIFDMVAMRKELIKQSLQEEEPEVPDDPPVVEKKFSFSVSSGLFDQNNTDTLGLSYPEGIETVTVWKADVSGDHYCNGVCLAEYKGDLYCQWQSSATDEDSDDTHVMYSVSSDKGRTWSEPQVLAQNIGNGYCTSGGWLATDDRLVAYINFWDNSLSPKGGYTYYITSEDGSSWTSPQQVTMADGSPMQGVFEQDPHVLSSGRIVNAAHFQPGLVVCPIYTDDPSGVSGWKKGNFTATQNGTQSVEMEPSIFVQSDGTLCMIFRDQTSSYKKLISYSYDDGETWSKVQSTDMPDARTKQSAGNLSDGTAFMAGCPVNNSLRSPLAVTLSSDGKNFNKAYLLRSNSSDPELVYTGTAKRKGFHYCKSLAANGELYVGYATNKEAVEITIVPEESLK